MKKNLVLFCALAVFAVSTLSTMPANARSHSNTGAIVAGTVIGAVAGLAVGAAVSNTTPTIVVNETPRRKCYRPLPPPRKHYYRHKRCCNYNRYPNYTYGYTTVRYVH